MRWVAQVRQQTPSHSLRPELSIIAAESCRQHKPTPHGRKCAAGAVMAVMAENGTHEFSSGKEQPSSITGSSSTVTAPRQQAQQAAAPHRGLR